MRFGFEITMYIAARYAGVGRIALAGLFADAARLSVHGRAILLAIRVDRLPQGQH
jgi:hypothetical protein